MSVAVSNSGVRRALALLTHMPRRRIGLLAGLALAISWGYSATLPDWLDGRDVGLYLDATGRWLAGGPFYEPYQLAGPYAISHGDVLYPPIGILLFAPFTALPVVLWWVIPIGIIVAVLVHLRPSFGGWMLIALCAAFPATVVKFSTGNPALWTVAAVALGARFGWPAVLVLLKPSLVPFALVGVRRRAWWVALGAFVVASIPFGSMWLDWLAALANSREGGLVYSIQELPMMSIPLIALLTRRRLGGTGTRTMPEPEPGPRQLPPVTASP